MHIYKIHRFAFALLPLLVSVSFGQDSPPPRGPEEKGPPQRRQGFMPVMPLQEALDTNHDGKLSAEEITAASESLKKLDKNKDGKLNAEEMGWPPRMPDFGRGGPPFGGGDRGGRSFAQRFLARDANGDGKVTEGELPKSMQWIVRLADIDNDGAVDKKEAEQFAQKHGMGTGSSPPK